MSTLPAAIPAMKIASGPNVTVTIPTRLLVRTAAPVLAAAA